MEPERKSLLGRIFWLPAAVLVVVELYASRFDGWGAWATGPLFLLPLILSLILSITGAVESIVEIRIHVASST